MPKKKRSEMRGYCAPAGVHAISPFAGVKVGAGYGGDASNGHRSYAAQKHGAKKYVRTRIRFHENAETRRQAKEVVA